MKLENGTPIYSATDLVAFLGCSHATALDVQVLRGSLVAGDEKRDPYLEILKTKGDEHERRHLEQLKREERSVIEIVKEGSLTAKTDATLRAMREGVDIIYQGALSSAPWHGYSDFLYKRNEPSDLGAWSYEVADTKLARSAKPKHVVQLCIYSDLVALVQKRLPAHAHILLGDGKTHSVRVLDYVHYVRTAQQRFLAFVGAATRETSADPCPHCGMCGWSDRCDDEWERTEHLSLVAALGRPQAKKLRAAGVSTIRELAEVPDNRSIPKLQGATLTRLRSQARLQMVHRSTGENRVEVLPPEPRFGFERLPKPNPGDLFFDMEGDPVYSAADAAGLEYLFGFSYMDDGTPRYKAIWARSRAEERKAFEDALDFITARLKKYPDAFVYHYASYETTALKRLALQYGTRPKEQVEALKLLAQMYGTRENEVDDLLRNRKFVDLYKVARESVRVSEPSYSLKNLEVFFGPKRTETIASGGDSIVAFERWLVTGDDSLLKQIEEYNAFDCRSTRLCRDWLLTLRPDETPWFDPASEIAADELEKEKKRQQEDAIYLAMREGLLEKSPVDAAELAWRALLGHLLEFHRREARNEWWEYFKRMRGTVEQLIDDSECIGGATVDESVAPRTDKQSLIWRLKFPEQEFKFCEGDTPVRQDTGKGAGTIVALNEDERWLELRAGKRQPALTGVVNLIPPGPFDDKVMRMAIARYAMEVLDGKADEYPAITGLLRRSRPRAPLAEGREPTSVIRGMKDTHLVIQGPPGGGKTYTSAHAIVALMEDGKRVGVTSHTHKAINNLLAEVEDVAAKKGVKFTGIKKSSEVDQKLGGSVIVDTDDNDDIVSGGHQLVGGTAWLFARADMAGALDFLFVDEAGQVSLANVVAMGLSAKNLVLVGDQMQLSQPTKGAHPGGSGVSALDYLMEGHATVPADRGIFLAQTWRMHPDVCRFISDAFYEGRLESAERTRQQRLILGDPRDDALGATGIRYVELDYEDNGQRSVEEAERVGAIYRSLLGQRWVNEKGETHPLTVQDILVVSPYNMQVNLLAQTLPAGARVGTVDKFQGQEAAVVLLSMAASSGASAPRGVQFLFSRNRLNVALSRARCLSVVVCSGELLATHCTTLANIELLSTFCRVPTATVVSA